MNNLEKWVRTIIPGETAKIPIRSVRVIQAIKSEFESLQKENAELKDVIRTFLKEPYGCPFCDSGILRKPNNPEKDHDDTCAFKMAAKLKL
jgi:hypothetical protein